MLLNCPISSHHINIVNFVNWTKDGEMINYRVEKWNRFEAKKKTLKINRAQLEDRGTYTCRGMSYGYGSVSVRIDLMVFGKFRLQTYLNILL